MTKKTRKNNNMAASLPTIIVGGCEREMVYWQFDDNGKLHCEGGPAAICKDGTAIWAIHGETRREDGPALVFGNGAVFWFQNGIVHRDDGPAVIYPCGCVEYWLHGGQVTREVYGAHAASNGFGGCV